MTASKQHLGGMKNELDCLPLDGACSYYLNYINNFQPDLYISASFYNRVQRERRPDADGDVKTLMLHALRNTAFLAPFDPNILEPLCATIPDQEAATRLKVCRATNAEPDLLDKLKTASMKHQGDELRTVARDALLRHPNWLLLADFLLTLDAFTGLEPDEALKRFQCPKVLAGAWELRLFNHFAGLGLTRQALALWPRLADRAADPFTLNRAAEMFRQAGDQAACLDLYRRSLDLDPLQYPVTLRLRQLENPFTPRPALVHEKKVRVYLYCYNKARELAETLQSLAGSRIGKAELAILVNGPSDEVRAAAHGARALFPNNAVEVIELPVNIGAPAARNWLISLPGTWESDYVAFLDDDVDVTPDWLEQFLTVAESDPGIANVGCKVVFPGHPALLQYLYRNVSVANAKLVRVSLPVPSGQWDIGLYDVVRPTRVVMGCQHLMRVSALREVPFFDIRYSPSQIDDTDHDLQFCLKGYTVAYCGTVTCVHKHGSGVSTRSAFDHARIGNVAGNDVKFYYKYLDHCEALSALDSLSLNA